MELKRYNSTLHWLAIALTVATFPLIFVGGLVTSHQAGLAVPDWPNSFGYNMFLFPPNQWVGGVFYEHTHRLMGMLVGFLAVTLVIHAQGPSANPKWRKIWGILTASQVASATTVSIVMLILQLSGKASFSLKSLTTVAVMSLYIAALLAGLMWICRPPETRKSVRKLCWIVLAAVILQGSFGGLRVLRLNIDLAVIHGCFAQAFFCLAALSALVTSRGWINTPRMAFGAYSSRGDPSRAAAAWNGR